MKEVMFSKPAKLAGSYDVVVCGGGPAGFIAAIAAAKQGARTAIIERFGFFGGLATAGYVAPISVFSYNGELNIGGIPWDFVKQLEAMGGALVEQPLNNVAFDIEKYKLCAQRMMIDAGVDMYMNSWITGVESKNGKVSKVFFSNKNGIEFVESKVFIDATGDADIAYEAGLTFQEWKDKTRQPVSMCFVLGGVDTKTALVGESMHHRLQGVNCHCLPVRERLLEIAEKEKLPSFGGPWFNAVLHDSCVVVNCTRINADILNNRNYTAAECRLREDVYKIVSVLKKEFKEFENCYVSSVATVAGHRESRHLKGVHVITAQEYLSSFKYEDSISRCSHPIDIHSASGAEQSVRFLEKAAYVPYRALVSKDSSNIIIAGRTVSAEKEPFASLRVQASCMGMGQAAGVAGAMATKAGCDVKDIDVKAFITTLKKLGAVLD